MKTSFEIDRGDLARITNQMSEDDLLAEERDDEADLWLGEWNNYLSHFYDHDESVYFVNAGRPKAA